MYNIETVESLHAYGNRLQRDGAQVSTSRSPRRSPVRSVLRRVRRST